MTPMEPSDLDEMTRGRWVAAKRECGDLWTPELDVDFATIERRVVASQCKARLAAAERRLQEHDDAGTEDLAMEIASIRGVCTSVNQISQLDRFSARVVVAAKRAAREREAEARRAAREEARAASVQTTSAAGADTQTAVVGKRATTVQRRNVVADMQLRPFEQSRMLFVARWCGGVLSRLAA